MKDKYFTAVGLMINNSRIHKKMVDLCVEELGIDRTRHLILIHIDKEGKLPAQNELARHLNITPPAITCALKKMEADGLIKRKVAKDNRFHETVLTQKGEDLLAKTKLFFNEINERIFSAFSEDELDAFITLSEKINKNMKNAREGESK